MSTDAPLGVIGDPGPDPGSGSSDTELSIRPEDIVRLRARSREVVVAPGKDVAVRASKGATVVLEQGADRVRFFDERAEEVPSSSGSTTIFDWDTYYQQLQLRKAPATEE